MHTKKTMKLMSWNANASKIKRIKNKKSKLDNQIEAIANVKADIVTLQEVSNEVSTYFKEKLSEIGFVCVETSHQFEGPPQYGVILASRWSLEIQPSFFDIPWQRCALSAIVKSNYGEIELHTVHVPNGRNHRCRKIDTFNGIYDALSQKSKRHRILCGDFNSPDKEFVDEQVIKVITFDEKNEKCDPIKGKDCERKVLNGLTKAEYDLADSYIELLKKRAAEHGRSLQDELNGYNTLEYSHVNNNPQTPRRRLDHIFSSTSLNPEECGYLHSFLDEGLSDHAPVYAVYKPKLLRLPIKKKAR